MNQDHITSLARVPWQPCEDLSWKQKQVKRDFQVELGKMLQNGLVSFEDREVPYLKAQHVQWDGIRFDDAPTMWASEKEIEFLKIEKGDLLVCEGGEVGRAAIVQSTPPEDCIIQNALHRVRGKSTSDVRFLRYLLLHASSQGWFDVLCNRATIAHFTVEKFCEMWIWLPPIQVQQVIADFLDRETAYLDALIAAKERLLKLLDEKRRALVTHAVTRGLDPDVKLRDSGEEWLGLVRPSPLAGITP